LVLALAAALAGEVVGQGASRGGGRSRGGSGRGSRSRRSSSRRASCSVPDCQTCKSGYTKECAKCKDGFTVVQGRCDPCSASCKACGSAGPGSCDVCLAGFVLVEDGSETRCEACADNCASCTCPTDPSCCKACAFGHALELVHASDDSYNQPVCSDSDTCPGLQRTCQPLWWLGWWKLAQLCFVTGTMGIFGFCFRLIIDDAPERRRPRGTPSRDPEHRHLLYVHQGSDEPTDSALLHVGHDGVAPYPSGLWRGYYNQRGRNFAVCEFELEFSATGLVRGGGRDTVGAYSIAGRFAGDRVAFTKQYVRGPYLGIFDEPDNLGHAVEYSGRRALSSPSAAHAAAGEAAPGDFGTGILGQWEIERDATRNVRSDSGSWHLWPVMDNWQQHRAPPSAHPSASPQMYRSGDGEDGEGDCCVCFDASIDCCLEPCRHVALCMGCAEKLQRARPSACPLCRAPIVHVHFLGGDSGS